MSLHSTYPKGFADGINVRGLPLLNTYSGKVFWVYNGSNLLVGQRAGSDQNKGTFDSPFATVDYAVGRCTANRGDVIMVKAGHNENFSAADSVDVDVAGVSIVGLGNGTDVPTFDYDNTAGEFVIGAANVLLENLRMRPSTNAVVNAINIEAAGDRFAIRGCRFADPETSTDEFADAVIVEAGADEGVIEHNVFSADAQAAVSAIELNGAVIGITIRNNSIIGDYSTACIRGDTTLSQKVVIEHNLLWNGDPLAGGLNAQPAIELLTGTIGVIRNNDIACNVASADLAIVADSCFLVGNRYSEQTGVGISSVMNDAVRRDVYVAVHESGAMSSNYDTGTRTIFTVTGDVLVRLSASVDVAVTSTLNNGTLEAGVTGATATLLVQDVADATAFAIGDTWTLTKACDTNAQELADDWVLIGNGVDIIVTIGTNNMTAGEIDFYCEWIPMVAGSSVVAA